MRIPFVGDTLVLVEEKTISTIKKVPVFQESS